MALNALEKYERQQKKRAGPKARVQKLAPAPKTSGLGAIRKAAASKMASTKSDAGAQRLKYFNRGTK